MYKNSSLALVAVTVLALAGGFNVNHAAAVTPETAAAEAAELLDAAKVEAGELVQTPEGVVSDAVVMEGGEEKPVEIGNKQSNVSALVNHSWKLVTLRTVPILPEINPDFSVSEDGIVSGDSGCNRFDGQGAYSADGTIGITEVRSTKRVCRDMKMADQEMKYVAALSFVRAWTVSEDGGTLFFYEGSGNEVMQFKKAAAAQ